MSMDPILHEFSKTLLDLESFKKAKEIIQTHGVNYKNKDAYGGTFLHMAAAFGDLQIMQYLIDNGADVNVTDYYEETPLYKSIMHCEPEPEECKDVVRLLLKYGACINTKPSPLELANSLLPKHDFVSLIEQTNMDRTCKSCGSPCDTIQNKPKLTATEDEKSVLELDKRLSKDEFVNQYH